MVFKICLIVLSCLCYVSSKPATNPGNGHNDSQLADNASRSETEPSLEERNVQDDYKIFRRSIESSNNNERMKIIFGNREVYKVYLQKIGDYKTKRKIDVEPLDVKNELGQPFYKRSLSHIRELLNNAAERIRTPSATDVYSKNKFKSFRHSRFSPKSEVEDEDAEVFNWPEVDELRSILSAPRKMSISTDDFKNLISQVESRIAAENLVHSSEFCNLDNEILEETCSRCLSIPDFNSPNHILYDKSTRIDNKKSCVVKNVKIMEKTLKPKLFQVRSNRMNKNVFEKKYVEYMKPRRIKQEVISCPVREVSGNSETIKTVYISNGLYTNPSQLSCFIFMDSNYVFPNDRENELEYADTTYKTNDVSVMFHIIDINEKIPDKSISKENSAQKPQNKEKIAEDNVQQKKLPADNIEENRPANEVNNTSTDKNIEDPEKAQNRESDSLNSKVIPEGDAEQKKPADNIEEMKPANDVGSTSTDKTTEHYEKPQDKESDPSNSKVIPQGNVQHNSLSTANVEEKKPANGVSNTSTDKTIEDSEKHQNKESDSLNSIAVPEDSVQQKKLPADNTEENRPANEVSNTSTDKNIVDPENAQNKESDSLNSKIIPEGDAEQKKPGDNIEELKPANDVGSTSTYKTTEHSEKPQDKESYPSNSKDIPQENVQHNSLSTANVEEKKPANGVSNTSTDKTIEDSEKHQNKESDSLNSKAIPEDSVQQKKLLADNIEENRPANEVSNTSTDKNIVDPENAQNKESGSLNSKGIPEGDAEQKKPGDNIEELKPANDVGSTSTYKTTEHSEKPQDKESDPSNSKDIPQENVQHNSLFTANVEEKKPANEVGNISTDKTIGDSEKHQNKKSDSLNSKAIPEDSVQQKKLLADNIEENRPANEVSNTSTDKNIVDPENAQNKESGSLNSKGIPEGDAEQKKPADNIEELKPANDVGSTSSELPQSSVKQKALKSRSLSNEPNIKEEVISGGSHIPTVKRLQNELDEAKKLYLQKIRKPSENDEAEVYDKEFCEISDNVRSDEICRRCLDGSEVIVQSNLQYDDSRFRETKCVDKKVNISQSSENVNGNIFRKTNSGKRSYVNRKIQEVKKYYDDAMQSVSHDQMVLTCPVKQRYENRVTRKYDKVYVANGIDTNPNRLSCFIFRGSEGNNRSNLTPISYVKDRIANMDELLKNDPFPKNHMKQRTRLRSSKTKKDLSVLREY